jgi:hypothetical protein
MYQNTVFVSRRLFRPVLREEIETDWHMRHTSVRRFLTDEKEWSKTWLATRSYGELNEAISRGSLWGARAQLFGMFLQVQRPQQVAALFYRLLRHLD